MHTGHSLPVTPRCDAHQQQTEKSLQHADGQVERRRHGGLELGLAVLHQQSHGEPSREVRVDVAVHEPHPGVVGHEAHDGPAADGHSDGVAAGRVHQVEPGGVAARVVVAEPRGQHVEVVAVDVHGVLLGGEDARVLEHDLHHGAVPDAVQAGALDGLPKRARDVLRGEVEEHGRERREVVGEHAGDVVVVRLQQGDGVGELERHVVHARAEPGVVGALAERAGAAVEEPEPHGGEHLVGHRAGHLHRHWAPEPVREGGRRVRVVERRQEREHRLRPCAAEVAGGPRGPAYWAAEGAAGTGSSPCPGGGGAAGGVLVLEDGGGGGVVEGDALGRSVGARGEVVSSRGCVGRDEDVGGLAGAEEDDVGLEGLGVHGVRGDHSHPVAGEADEELGVHGRVDDAQQARLAGDHRDDARLCIVGLGDTCMHEQREKISCELGWRRRKACIIAGQSG
jgi:hypothetical protein